MANNPDHVEVQDWQPQHLQLAIEAAGVALWAWNVDDDRFAMDHRGFELWGLEWARSDIMLRLDIARLVDVGG